MPAQQFVYIFVANVKRRRRARHLTVFRAPFKITNDIKFYIRKFRFNSAKMYSNYKILNLNARSSPPQDKESFPTIKQPHRAGEYSLSPEGHYEDSPARLCFLTQLGPNTFPFSLNASGESINTEQSFLKPRYLDNMFCFLRCSIETLIKRHENGHLQVDADIVCSREALQLIMCAPYEYKNNWTIAVSKYRNTIYICPVPDSERPQSFFDPEHLKKLMMDHWMTKLRQRCLVAMGNYLNPAVA